MLTGTNAREGERYRAEELINELVCNHSERGRVEELVVVLVQVRPNIYIYLDP